jgi:hypothetical protein
LSGGQCKVPVPLRWSVSKTYVRAMVWIGGEEGGRGRAGIAGAGEG